ncbi:MAG: dephospho-CoA kinase [Rikenellaceae bacterium]|nr:dephospho-CoA kinase [Rikenellaceae bacterium]MDE7133871.1 dephospho-CoA kinase [Rikenellaceae bacterium]MDE7355449.1 dephospho-CoA kinase [Rikenellaceae bacterium]
MSVKIAITGGIGSGKSTVCMAVRAMGYPIYDSDKEARRLMEEKETIIESVVEVFGPEAYHEGHLNRRAVAEKAFSSPDKLLKLNSIVHPAVIEDFSAWASRQKSGLVFIETAILFESGLDKAVDTIVVITAPEELRIERIVRRDGCSAGEARRRIDAQMSQERLAEAADYVITADDATPVLPQLEGVLAELEEKNVF